MKDSIQMPKSTRLLRDKQVDKKVFTRPYRNEKLDASELIESVCCGHDYDRGSVETAFAQAENTSKVLGRLVEQLFEKGVLTKAEVYKVALGYDK